MSSKPDLLTSLMNANLEIKPKPTPSMNQTQQLSYGNYNNVTPNPNQNMWNKPQSATSTAYHVPNNNNDVMDSMSSLDAFLGPPLPGQKVVSYPSDPFSSSTSLLQPQNTSNNSTTKNNKNSVQLSQQDILNFLN